MPDWFAVTITTSTVVLSTVLVLSSNFSNPMNHLLAAEYTYSCFHNVFLSMSPLRSPGLVVSALLSRESTNVVAAAAFFL